MDEPMAMYSGYDFSDKGEGSFWNSSIDDLFFETDAEGHCLSFGVCYGEWPAVEVLIWPPKVSVETARTVLRKIADRVTEERQERVASSPPWDFHTSLEYDDRLFEEVNGCRVEVWILTRFKGVLRYRQDAIVAGKLTRTRKETRLALVQNTSARDARRLAAECLRPLNQGLESIGSATNFNHYVETTYLPVVMPLMAKSTRDRSEGVISNYLVPAFGKLCLRDVTPLTVQRYFSNMSTSTLAHESRDKIRDVLSSVLASAVKYGLLVKNPVEAVRLPAERRGRRHDKPYLSPAQFDQLVALIPEPYASMAYIAIYTGLRVSELAGLRWNDIHADGITIDERFCRGDWGAPKSEASNATIAVNQCVVQRIHRLKLLTVEVKGGGPGNKAIRKYKVVKSCGPDDLVFQSVRDGKPIRDNNILSRFIKPAARTLGLSWVNWRCLRTSHAVWLKLAGADVKDAQGQMRHSRASTTLDIYQQFVPESQQKVVAKLSSLSRMVN